jgi:hypothetical protein
MLNLELLVVTIVKVKAKEGLWQLTFDVFNYSYDFNCDFDLLNLKNDKTGFLKIFFCWFILQYLTDTNRVLSNRISETDQNLNQLKLENNGLNNELKEIK